MWSIAIIGALATWVSVLIWPLRSPVEFSLAIWQPLYTGGLRWLADGYSWPYALSLATLTLGIILTSVIHLPRAPLTGAGVFLLTALGILSVTSDNPLTLVLTWAALDLAELITMFRAARGDQANEVVTAFTVRLIGLGLVTWAATRSSIFLDFHLMPPEAGLYLLTAVGLRLGVLPLHLPYRQEPILRRDYGTALRLVSAASSLAVLARLPENALPRLLTPYLLFFCATAAVYGGYSWLRASDEIIGRPFWILGMGGISLAAMLSSRALASVSWGAVLILAGGGLFLYSARHRLLLGLFMITALGLSSLPFTASAPGWIGITSSAWPFWVLLLISQALLLSGFVRQAAHSGESSLESHLPWTRTLYTIGLGLFPGVLILLGLWGWPGAKMIGVWWPSLIVLVSATLLTWLFDRLARRGEVIPHWSALPFLQKLYQWSWRPITWLGGIASFINEILEGEGGMLWSLLILALLASLLTRL